MPPKKETRGRKTVKDKKIQICIYIRESVIKEHGGQDAAKKKAIKYLDPK